MKQYIQLTAGRGPVECARAVTLVARVLLREHPAIELVDSEPHNQVPDCYMSLTFSIEGEESELAAIRSQWGGTVQYVATKNPYRPGHKRRNWFVGVNFIDPVELPEINDTDITYESCRSGGKGGQNVNKVETAVRATHTPTGLAVRCSDERSQQQNKARARERLLLKLAEHNAATNAQAAKDTWVNHTTLSRGNAVKILKGSL